MPVVHWNTIFFFDSYLLCFSTLFDRVGYAYFPRLTVKRETKNYAFKAGLLKGYLRHLFSGRMADFDAKLHRNIALSHFSPLVLSENSKRGPKQNFISIIESDMAREIGLMPVDRVAGVNKFYALPNFTHEAVMAYIAVIENEAISRGSNIESTTRLSSSSKVILREMSVAAAIEVDLRVKAKERLDADVVERATLSGTQELLFGRIQSDYITKIEELEEKLSVSNIALKAARDMLTSERAASDTVVEKYLKEKKDNEGGLQRMTILTAAWHTSNPSLCNHLFGFRTFAEYKIYCTALFPELVLLFAATNLDPITEWEKCTLTIMKFRRNVSNKILAAIWNRGRTVIGKYVLEWSVKWGRAAENMIDLDISNEYLNAERPQIFSDANQREVAVLVDGKDFMINDPKKNSAIKRATWSDKVHHSAGRLITWSTPAGLIVEVTPLYLGRATESAIVALWGSHYGIVPLCKVPDIPLPALQFAKTENYKENGSFLSALIRNERKRGSTLDDNADDVLNGENEELDDVIVEAQADAGDSVPSISMTERSKVFLNRMRDRVTRTQSGKKYSASRVTEMNDYLLRQGPNESSTRKLEQLVLHENLHLAFQNGSLGNCIFAYYLKENEAMRCEMLRHLRGEAGQDVPPMVLTRLAKIPVGGTVLADRGFYFDAPSYPNVNAQITPHFLTGRDQFEEDEISNDLITCRLRWSSEAVFSRVTDQEALTDVIPYEYFSILESIIKWGHARANLMQPFNKPTNYEV